jgi:alpha-L-rhamnosidase
METYAPPGSLLSANLHLGALKQAADIEGAIGEPSRAASNRAAATDLSHAVQQHCWSAERSRYADNPAKTQFSQHANILAVLYDVAPQAQRIAVLDRVTVRGGGIAAPPDITGTTYYFAFYLARALDHAGLADRYPELLSTWRRMLAQNFTTWPEEPDPSRSDSHAWSAHPTADLLRLVAGIEPGSPGYRTVRIAPHLASLTSLDAAAMTPSGPVAVKYKVIGARLAVSIDLPVGLSGVFEWQRRSFPLTSGKHRLTVPFAAPHSGEDMIKTSRQGRSQ